MSYIAFKIKENEFINKSLLSKHIFRSFAAFVSPLVSLRCCIHSCRTIIQLSSPFNPISFIFLLVFLSIHSLGGAIALNLDGRRFFYSRGSRISANRAAGGGEGERGRGGERPIGFHKLEAVSFTLILVVYL